MLETSRVPVRLWGVLLVAVVAGCAAYEPQVVERPAPPPVEVAPAPPVADAGAKLMEEAKALLAQAETDVQRARAKRALWLKAWEDLIAARNAVAARDAATAIRHARRASEFAQLGLEQLAYPAVK
jgi:hypothetical protein